jgi:hypothetical protein
MNDNEEYEFWIDAYSPQTIAMKRLGEYMARLGKLLGQEDRVHFKALHGGSTALHYSVEREAVPKIHERIDSIKRADAANDAINAQNELNDMLRSDDAVAEIRHIGKNKPEAILRLAGREIPKPQKIGPFSEPATFKGTLVRLEGEDETKHAGIKDAQGRVWSGEMSLDLAVQMRELLFEWVFVEGMARWIRNEDGTWELKHFRINSCKPLPKDTLEDDITNLRNIGGNGWKEMPDPIGYIRESRNDDDEIH